MRSIRVPVVILLSLTVPNLTVPSLAFAAGTSGPISSEFADPLFAQIPPPPSTGPTQPAPATTTTTTTPAPAPTEGLSEDQKEERAKELYMRAEGLSTQGNWIDSVPLYEEAYYLVPGKHGFAYKVGVAAWNAGDCNKANDYLKHFIKYGDLEKNADKAAEAKQILGDISVSGCATEDTTTTTTTKTVDPSENENPLGASTTEVRQGEAKGAREAKKSEKKGLLLGGAVLAGIGVAGLGMGIAGLAIANGSANTLKALSTNQTQSGFPVGDYACRGVPSSECPSDLERRMSTGNVLGGVGLAVGGAALIGGAVMLAIYMVNRKKQGNNLETARAGSGVALSGLGPMLVPGGGAGAMAEIRF